MNINKSPYLVGKLTQSPKENNNFFMEYYRLNSHDIALNKICKKKKPECIKLELDMEQPTGSKLGMEYAKTVYCHPAYLASMQSTSCKIPGWMKHKLE